MSKKRKVGLNFDRGASSWKITGLDPESANPMRQAKYRQELDLMDRIEADPTSIIRSLKEQFGWDETARRLGVTVRYLQSGSGMYNPSIRLQEKALGAFRRAAGAIKASNLRTAKDKAMEAVESVHVPGVWHISESVGQLTPSGFRRMARNWMWKLSAKEAETGGIATIIVVSVRMPVLAAVWAGPADLTYQRVRHRDKTVTFSTDPARIDRSNIEAYLDELSAWAAGQPNMRDVEVSFYARIE